MPAVGRVRSFGDALYAVIVTLTTDFGLRDGYVAAMKGTMLSVAPALQMVDVSHAVPPQDVMAAAFTLRSVVPHFPSGTVHLVVVDPGVGTERAALAARFENADRDFFYVGPDNGTLSLLVGNHAVSEAVTLDTRGASRTFHGRDVFGPAAAALAAGATLADLGTPIDGLMPLLWPLPRVDSQGIYGMVLHIDHFGNCQTNITRRDLDGPSADRRFKCFAGSAVVRRHVQTYAEVGAGDPMTLFGSSEHLEIAVNRGNAAELLSVDRGDAVNLVFERPPADPEPMEP